MHFAIKKLIMRKKMFTASVRKKKMTQFLYFKFEFATTFFDFKLKLVYKVLKSFTLRKI